MTNEERHKSLQINKNINKAKLVFGLFSSSRKLIYVSGVFFALTLVFYFGNQDARENKDTELKELVLYDVNFKVFKSPRGTEPRVILFKGGREVFSATCDGIRENICVENNFINNTVAKYIVVLEAQPKKGALKMGEYINEHGGSVGFVNPSALDYIKNSHQKAMRPVWFCILGFCVFFALALLSILVNVKKLRN